MKRLLALLLALALTMVLCACGGSETSKTPETQDVPESQEGLYEKSGTLEDGTTFTTYRSGGPDGTPVKLIYDTPDGLHYEEYYTPEGLPEHSISTYGDGSSYEVFYYPSGNMSKSITKMADGSYDELHFLDNGYVDENGWLTSGMVSYEKHVTADGQVEERSENMELEADGSWWSTFEADDGTIFKTHFRPDGTTLEQYQDHPDTGMHGVTVYYENGNQKSQETRYDNSEKYTQRDFHENGIVKYSYYRSEDGTEQEEQVTEQGYTTYLRTTSSHGESEFFADENGNLLKYVDNGKVSEGSAIPSHILQSWESLKSIHVPDEGESVTEENPDGSYWKTTTYRGGTVTKELYSAEDVLISQETTDPNNGITYTEFNSSGVMTYQKYTFHEKTYEYTYDEDGYEIYYHETGGGQEVEMIADETGKLVTILVNGEEKTGNDFIWYSTGHNFRS